MTFEQYYQIMKTHGVCEFEFHFDGAECELNIEICDLRLVYNLSANLCDKNCWVSFDDLDACVSAPVFTGDRCLRDIWDEIEIRLVDGVSVEYYDAEICSFNFVQYLADQGELLWSCHLGAKQTFWREFRVACLACVFWTLVLSLPFPLTGLSNWNILYLTGGCAVLSLIIAAIALLRNRRDIEYHITTKKVFIYNGLTLETEFGNIKKVKMRRSLFNKNRGTIKLKLKKGCSFNCLLEGIPEVDQVYNLILEKMQ